MELDPPSTRPRGQWMRRPAVPALQQGRAPRQCMPGRCHAAAQRGCKRGSHIFWQMRQIPIAWHSHKFCKCSRLYKSGQPLIEAGIAVPPPAVRAGAAREDEGRNQPVADLVGRVWSCRNDLATVFMPANLARLHARMLSDPAMPIRSANPTRQDLEDDPVIRAIRIGHILDRKVFAIGSENGGAHQISSTS